jgi:pimeloyl-ACP methyl ester carboxylesterase
MLADDALARVELGQDLLLHRLIVLGALPGSSPAWLTPRVEELSVAVPGGELCAWRLGSGAPALVLHGGPMTDLTRPLGELLAPVLECVGYQQRGLPPSTLEPPFDVDAHVRDAVAVLDAAGWERAWVVGHSWGGHLALHLAAAHPERLLGVISIDGLGGAPPDGRWSDLDRGIVDRFAADDPAGAERAEELDRRAMAGDATREDMDESLTLIWPYYFHDPLAAPPMPPVEVSVPLYAAVVSSVRDHFGRGTLERGLAAFERPALFVHGASDPLPPAAAEETAALLPDAQVVVLERCGHCPWLEQPDALFEAVSAFVAR